MVPVSLVVRSRAMQGMRAGVASWRWSLSLSGASALWPMHQAGQSVVGGVLFSSVWSAGVAIGLPFLSLWVCGGAVRGRVKRRDGSDGRGRAEGEQENLKCTRNTLIVQILQKGVGRTQTDHANI